MKMMMAAVGMLALLGACDWMNKKEAPGAKSEAEQRAERDQRMRACSSSAT